MKIWSFLKWRWQKYERWQKWWMVGFFFLGAGIGQPEPIKYYLWAIPICIFFFYTGKWWIWDSIRDSYREYQKEKEDLITLIKSTEK